MTGPTPRALVLMVLVWICLVAAACGMVAYVVDVVPAQGPRRTSPPTTPRSTP